MKWIDWLLGVERTEAPRRGFLCELGGNPLTLEHACQGIAIFGVTGSGKTTGPGATIARALLEAGVGFCVMAAKVDEYQRWVRLCEQAGRSADLVRFGPGSGLCCDVLNYELSAPGGTVESAASLIESLIQVASRSGGHGEEQYWALSCQKAIRNAVSAINIATGGCSMGDVYRFMVSLPESRARVQDAEWRKESYAAQCLMVVEKKAPPHEADLLLNFWLVEWPELSTKPRSIIHSMVTNTLAKFLSSPLREMVTGETNVSPGDAARGKIIVLDMPVLRWRELGQFFQVIFKTLVQRDALRREITPGMKPVCLWSDEAQWFCLPEQDAMTQTVARQSKLISVTITQNLPTLYAALGGNEKARMEGEGWIGNHAVKVLTANSCPATNQYFSDMIGSSKQMFLTVSPGAQEYDPIEDVMGRRKARGGCSASEHWHPDVPPNDFVTLAKGGEESGFVVEAICFHGGRKFNTGKPWVRCGFRQEF